MKSRLTPRNQINLVKLSSVERLEPSNISIGLVGEKGFGLACLPASWTLPFFVISSEFIETVRNTDNLETTIGSFVCVCQEAAAMLNFDDEENILIRSSAINESLSERGKYHTISSSLKDLHKGLASYIFLIENDNDILSDEAICIVIQKCAINSIKGHLSNERRFYKEPRDWVGQLELENQSEQFQVNLRNWRKKDNVDKLAGMPLKCNLSVNIQNILRFVAGWGMKHSSRLHFEWVWDGRCIYLVQVEEEKYDGQFDPIKNAIGNSIANIDYVPKLLECITRNHGERYNKIRNAYVYLDLELPITTLYILEDNEVINEISKKIFSKELLCDLKELTKCSLVIRIDIQSDDKEKRQLLPRTHEVRNIEEARTWLTEQASMLLANSNNEKAAFIFHRFIPAESAAFAFAAPGERKVLIEALWGIPEGLYYNPHDKFIVDTLDKKDKKFDDHVGRYVLTKHANHKPVCVAPTENGKWEIQRLKIPYDWNLSIKNDEWVKIIARDSRRIAEYEKKSVSIMWFVGVPESSSKSPVFPWYHEEYKKESIPRSNNRRKKTPFDKQIIVRNKSDIIKFQHLVEVGESKIRQVLVQPIEEDILRDKLVLREIGKLAKEIDAVILLKGATLSHAFYQLVSTGANVHVENPFDKNEDNREFDKLVRDKIPDNIRDGGELVETKTLEGEHLFRALREKLVEESIEVLDSKDHDAVLDELSDVLEVIDGILGHLGADYEEIEERKLIKRERVGAFNKGSVLLRTRNPSPSSRVIDDVNLQLGFEDEHNIIEKSTKDHGKLIKIWKDKREHHAATEVLLNIEIPILLEKWSAETSEVVVNKKTNETIIATVKGKRTKEKVKIEMSVYSAGQMDLLDN